MTSDISKIYLLEASTGAEVEADLFDSIEACHLIDWKTKWQPDLISALQEFSRRGGEPSQWPQSWHWQWDKKIAKIEGLLAYRGFCVVAQGVTQGLAQVSLNELAREGSQKGKPMVYLDYLEVAPWNRPDFGRPIVLRGVGTALLSACVALSFDEGFKGRIGLHSLPQADDFYRRRCHMADLGQDPGYDNLRYFEMTTAQANAFLGEEE